MTRAFAGVAAGGRSITPYGITKVTTIDGEIVYRHKRSAQVQLVEGYVAAAMVDLMQSAVAAGTGKAAQIGRPVAGKTGTTQSNKDGWFLGFSSGLTTGVWMGRDDARAVGNLQGGTAPAKAWAAYMRSAVANRPVEQFASNVTFPERLDGEGPALGEEEQENLVDDGAVEGSDGAIIDPDVPPDPDAPQPIDDEFIDKAIGRNRDARGTDDGDPDGPQ
jgi:penicillin-binding protein 1A